MKWYVEVDKSTGKIIKAMYCSYRAASMSIGSTSDLYECSEETYKKAISGDCYYELGQVYLVPPKPSEGCHFNYVTRMWEDLRSLSDVMDAKWESIKEQRDSLEFGGFMFKGMEFDSDLISQGRILAAASLGSPVEWTLADNSRTFLTQQDLGELVYTLSEHINSVHTRGRVARDAIYSASNFAEVEAVIL